MATSTSSPFPTPMPSPNISEVCLPVFNCLPVSGGISEGGYIVLLLLIAVIIIGSLAFLVAFRYGAAILKAAREAREEAKAAKYEVKNSHEVNLRDDIDSKDTASHVKLDEILEQVASVKEDVNTVYRSLSARMDGVDSRFAGLDARLNGRSGTISGKEV